MVPAKATTNKPCGLPQLSSAISGDPLVSAERRGKSKESKGKT